MRRQECDHFLAILCEVFDLDYSLAYGVFFAEPGFDPGRKWALFADGEMKSILTTTPLMFGDSKAIGIAGVATIPSARGQGLAERLVAEVCAVSEAQGAREAILFAKRTHLYARCGFEVIDEVVRGPITATGYDESQTNLSTEQVERLYNAWCERSPRRLRRDSFGWARWKFNLKVCESMGLGYGCIEGSTMREAVLNEPLTAWPVPLGTEWYGLRSLTTELGVPGDMASAELFLMGRNCSEPPQMFMTDQF